MTPAMATGAKSGSRQKVYWTSNFESFAHKHVNMEQIQTNVPMFLTQPNETECRETAMAILFCSISGQEIDRAMLSGQGSITLGGVAGSVSAEVFPSRILRGRHQSASKPNAVG